MTSKDANLQTQPPFAPHLRGADYGKKTIDLCPDHVYLVAHEAIDAALHGEHIDGDPPGVGLESPEEETRTDLRKAIMSKLNGAYVSVQVDTLRGWWQIKLLNGAIIRVSKPK